MPRKSVSSLGRRSNRTGLSGKTGLRVPVVCPETPKVRFGGEAGGGSRERRAASGLRSKCALPGRIWTATRASGEAAAPRAGVGVPRPRGGALGGLRAGIGLDAVAPARRGCRPAGRACCRLRAAGRRRGRRPCARPPQSPGLGRRPRTPGAGAPPAPARRALGCRARAAVRRGAVRFRPGRAESNRTGVGRLRGERSGAVSADQPGVRSKGLKGFGFETARGGSGRRGAA